MDSLETKRKYEKMIHDSIDGQWKNTGRVEMIKRDSGIDVIFTNESGERERQPFLDVPDSIYKDLTFEYNLIEIEEDKSTSDSQDIDYSDPKQNPLIPKNEVDKKKDDISDNPLIPKNEKFNIDDLNNPLIPKKSGPENNDIIPDK